CDDWGCYYNQRDNQWGGAALNHTQYSIASDGCLLTSMAMVYTHFGHRSVTPLTINSDPNNFASYYPAYLKYTITADGASASRVGGTIDSELSAGRPVIVGVSYDGGPIPDHFVVLISGSGGNYQMNDPFTPNGHDIPFTSKYAVGSIREVDKVVM
ncbi:MAG TPA: C39 family peptidase, partial [Patescibacteria group bacterium]